MTIEELEQRRAQEKRDLKALVPQVIQEMAKGRKFYDITREMGLPQSSASGLKYHVDRRLESTGQKDETEDIYIIPEKPKGVKYVWYNGKRYRDITAEVVDCGG